MVTPNVIGLDLGTRLPFTVHICLHLHQKVQKTELLSIRAVGTRSVPRRGVPEARWLNNYSVVYTVHSMYVCTYTGYII